MGVDKMTRKISYTALASRVIVVAVANYDSDVLFDWTAYIDSVPGQNHELEYQEVARTGAKLSEHIAAVLFPHLDIDKYRT